jgi:hypothetical protein
MRPTLVVATALLLLSGNGVAKAADPTRLAETGGFLLGNAHRCGIETERVEHAGTVVHDMIVSASYDPTEEAAADSRFARIFMASAYPGQDGDVDPTLQGSDRAIRMSGATSSASRHAVRNLPRFIIRRCQNEMTDWQKCFEGEWQWSKTDISSRKTGLG